MSTQLQPILVDPGKCILLCLKTLVKDFPGLPFEVQARVAQIMTQSLATSSNPDDVPNKTAFEESMLEYMQKNTP